MLLWLNITLFSPHLRKRYSSYQVQGFSLGFVSEEDEWKIILPTTSGYYEYLVMPYGFVYVPSVFQLFLNRELI